MKILNFPNLFSAIFSDISWNMKIKVSVVEGLIVTNDIQYYLLK